MNNLRTPIAILVVIIIALVAWFLLAHESSTPSSVSTTASTSSAQTTSVPTTPAPTLDPSIVATNAVGTWQSTDDPNYTVTIGSNGSWTDTYKGENPSDSATETGTYELFTSTNPDKDFTGTLVAGAVYVKVTEGKDTLYYSVLEANSSNLQLSYLDRGNTLSFVRVE